MFQQAVIYNQMQHSLLRVLRGHSRTVFCSSNSRVRPTGEIESSRAVEDEMLLIPSMHACMERQCRQNPLLTWEREVDMPPLQVGKLPEAAKSEAQYQFNVSLIGVLFVVRSYC